MNRGKADMTQEQKLERIPMPDKMPLVGNMLSVDKDQPLQSLMQMTRELGPIMRMDMMGTPLVVASGHDLVDELCDETRFDKAVRGSCLLYTSPSPRDREKSRMPSSA